MSSVLVVDDDADILFAILDALAAAGYHAHRASSGEEALDLLRTPRDLALVLLDVQMPGLTGLEVISIARQELALERLPFVLMTAASNVVAPARTPLLRKPFSLVQLLDLAAEYLDEPGTGVFAVPEVDGRRRDPAPRLSCAAPPEGERVPTPELFSPRRGP